MKSAIIVGYTSDSKCHVSRYNGESWYDDPDFPDVPGHLYAVYSYSSKCIWVCGEHLGSPIIFLYNGSSWVDYSSSITDANSLFAIDGSSDNNVWVSGMYSGGANQLGLWHFDGFAWTPIKQNNTLYYAATFIPHLSVSLDGTCYTPGNSTYYYGGGKEIYSNKTDPAFSVFYDHPTATQEVSAISDTAIISAGVYQGYRYNGVWSTVPTPGYGHVSAQDYDHFIYFDAGRLKYYNNGVVDIISSPLSGMSISLQWCVADKESDLYADGNAIWSPLATDYDTVYYNYQGGTLWDTYSRAFTTFRDAAFAPVVPRGSASVRAPTGKFFVDRFRLV